MQKLENTHSKIKLILGENTESLESVRLVETYRRFLKPEKVRVILLAESHVFTHDEDRKIPMQAIPDLQGMPDQYARFVYCLGYGEKSLTRNENHPNGDGTPQFWKILFSCCNPVSSNDDFSPILRKTPTNQRIENKIKILKHLKEQGIWLVDASIVALYKDSKKIPFMFDALKESWHSYTRDIVLEAKPEHVICIGKGVEAIVKPDLEKHFNSRYTVIAQPNARLSSEKHLANFKSYNQICCK